MINIIKEYGFIKKKMDINDLDDCFLDSFSIDYKDFKKWFSQKAEINDFAFYHYNEGKMDGFIKLKKELGCDIGLNNEMVVKISSLKLGISCKIFFNKIMEKILIFSKNEEINIVFLTCNERHIKLLSKLKEFEFEKYKKIDNEIILIKKLNKT